MTETFNSIIVFPRQKPIVTMLEHIRIYLMESWEKIARKWRIMQTIFYQTLGKNLKENPILQTIRCSGMQTTFLNFKLVFYRLNTTFSPFSLTEFSS